VPRVFIGVPLGAKPSIFSLEIWVINYSGYSWISSMRTSSF